MAKKMVIWPAYLTVRRTRGEGRKISRRTAVKSPRLEEMEKAARVLDLGVDLKLELEVEEGKAYPKTHWDKSGRVVVKKVGGRTKGEIVKEIAKGIKEMRERSKKG